VPLVVVELKTEIAHAATLHPPMVDWPVQGQALTAPLATLKHAQQ
jgi:hypothetical protein